MKFILAKKISMTQVFDEEGRVAPVTLVEAGPCYVTQIKTKDKDGYEAIQVSFGQRKLKNIKKPQKGCLEKLKQANKELSDKFQKTAPCYWREFKVDDVSSFNIGDQITVTNFELGDRIRVSGISKAKGFQGVVKRHGFSGFNATHGTKHGERAPGSIGSAFPERVWPGKKMAGRTGGNRVTLKNLKIAKVDTENNLLAIRGALPGRKGTLFEIEKLKM